MNKVLMSILFGFVGLFVSVVLLVAMSYVTYYNYGNRIERQIEAAYEDNQNVLSQYTLKIQEMAQVPAMYKDDLKEVYTAAITGRYGKDGSTAMFQWLKEHNPNFSDKLYTKIQQVMEAGRNKFEHSQTRLIDLKRQYKTKLGNFWSGLWLGFIGYPKINLDDFKVVKSTKAVEVFDSGIDSGVKLW